MATLQSLVDLLQRRRQHQSASCHTCREACPATGVLQVLGGAWWSLWTPNAYITMWRCCYWSIPNQFLCKYVYLRWICVLPISNWQEHFRYAPCSSLGTPTSWLCSTGLSAEELVGLAKVRGSKEADPDSTFPWSQRDSVAVLSSWQYEFKDVQGFLNMQGAARRVSQTGDGQERRSPQCGFHIFQLASRKLEIQSDTVYAVQTMAWFWISQVRHMAGYRGTGSA